MYYMSINEVIDRTGFTNADRIRAMSDEELAKNLSNACLGCVVKDCKLHNYASYGCEKNFLEWLKQPAEET